MSLLLYCRAGFEGECAAEVQERAAGLGVHGYCKAKPDSAYVLFVAHDPAAAAGLARRLPFADLVFPRQLLDYLGLEDRLPVDDRVTPLLDRLGGRPVAGLVIETPDTNEGKQLAALCRKLLPPLRAALSARGLLRDDPALPRLHLLFLSSTAAHAGLAWPGNASPWPMGVPRLKFPGAAPSRSTLKLEEAFLHFLTPEEREQRLHGGLRAVDLGAAPGGWTYQLVRRSLWVTAVDNGPMDPRLLDSGQVEHRREDAFRYRPPAPVDWMVCDVVEQPIRIARLVARWVAEGWCAETLFNLKLPMKRRWQEVQRCDAAIREALDAAGVRYRLRYRQLYHDREEITGHLRRL